MGAQASACCVCREKGPLPSDIYDLENMKLQHFNSSQANNVVVNLNHYKHVKEVQDYTLPEVSHLDLPNESLYLNYNSVNNDTRT
jgi:hypothetical protein